MKIDDELNKLKDDIPEINSNLDDLILDKHQQKRNSRQAMTLRKLLLILSPMLVFSITFAALLILMPKNINSGISDSTKQEPTTYNVIRKQAKKEDVSSSINSEEYKAFCKKLQAFSIKLSEEYYRNNQNEYPTYSMSPISVVNVLGLAIECTNGNTRNEILEALGVTYEEVLRYYPILQNSINKGISKKDAFGFTKQTGRYYTNNSIWYDDDISAFDNTLDSLANNYYADIFNINFDYNNFAASKIKEYINESTNKLLNPKIQVSNQTKIVLLNTIYAEDIWANDISIYDKQNQFKNCDDTIVNTELYVSEYNYGKIGKTEEMSYYYLPTEDIFKVYFMVPNDGYTVKDIYNSNSINIMLANDFKAYNEEEDKIYLSNIVFPGFDAKLNTSLQKELNTLGIKSIFSSDADFSNISNTNLYADDVVQGSRLIVNKDGIKGAAYTYMSVSTSVDPSKLVYETLYVTKAFAYVVVDDCNNITFTGVINKL